jgi:predicted phage tail protein
LGFEQHVLALSAQGIKFAVVLQQGSRSNYLIEDPQWLSTELKESATLIIAPVPVAAGGAGKFLLGVGLIAVSAFLPGTIGILGTSISSTTIGLYGAGLVVGSILQWLSPKPPEQKQSVIAGTVAANQQGAPIPIVYGRRFVAPTVISGGTSILDLSTTESRGDGGFLGIGGWSETYLAPRSIAKLQVVDALCEGPIKGLVGDENGIWLNGVPFQTADGTFSYLGLRTETYDLYGSKTVTITPPTLRLGTQSDAMLPAPWQQVTGEVSVNQIIKQSTGGATRRINKANLDAIKVRLYWQSCNNYGGSDGLGGLRTAHQISIKEGNGAWQVRHVDNIYALSTSPFERETSFSVGQAPYYEVKVERIIPDQPANKLTTLVDVASWKSYVTVVNAKLRYPNTAKIGIEVNLERFGATDLERRYHLDGLIIKIPSNATVRTDGSLQYSGLWDGTFINAWTCDPAWCLYDLITNSRYGLNIAARKLDKFAFYTCSTYCAELINDGFGAQEPRFNLNCIIKDKESAYSLIQKVCGMFNSIPYYEAGALMPSIDQPQAPVHIFTNANAQFKYAGTPYRSRRNRAVVSYTRPEIPDVQDYEFHEDKEHIKRIKDVRETRIDAFGCTSRGQAKRIARWTIYTEQQQKESIIIVCGMDGAHVRPGQIVEVGDRDRAGLRRWGRIVSATINSVTIDQPINLPAGNYTLSCTLPDATLVERTIYNPGNNLTTIQVTPDFDVIPDRDASWLVAGADLQPELWRIIGRVESGLEKYELTGVIHQPSKFASIEQNLNLSEPPRAIQIPSPPLPPQNLQLTVVQGIGVSISATWSAPAPATYTVGYQVRYKQVGNLITAPVSTVATSYLIGSVSYGEYEVQVRAIDSTGAYSGWVVTTIDIPFAAYFGSSYLLQVPVGFGSSVSPISEDSVPVSFANSTYIQPEPQTHFGSSTYIVLLN